MHNYTFINYITITCTRQLQLHVIVIRSLIYQLQLHTTIVINYN